ncbi:MAG: aminotransferase class V-fold PLP-dependent enzyme [Verrucomicrobiales bacterium]
MTIEELHSNEELRQHEFPATRNQIFLAHAGVCPLPRRVSEAIRKYADDCTRHDQEEVSHDSFISETRALAAKFIQAEPSEVAFVGPTSLALSFVAEGLKFRRNSHVLVYQDDYPSNVYPWMTLASKGVEVQFLNIRELGMIRARDVLGQVDENTRLVAITSAHFLAGYRADIDAIGKQLRERGVLFCVDAIQTLGAFPTSSQHVDFMAADAHKWLLGPCAAGLMYVRKQAQELLRPTTHGWHNIRCPDYVAQDDMIYRTDAKKFEAGSFNFLGMVGLRASLELLMEIGIEKIGRELLRKRTYLVQALQKKGFAVLQPSANAEQTSGITTFFKAGENMAAIHQKLKEANIITSLRADRTGQKYIRLSPHFYNTDTELEKMVSLL